MRQTVFEESLNGITIDRVIRDYSYTMPTKHLHDEYEIYYLLEGERYYFISQHTYHIKKGSLVFVNRNVIHKTGNVSQTYHDRILIEFSEEPFATFFASMNDLDLHDFFETCTGVIECDPREQSTVESLLIGIHTEMRDKRPGYKLNVMMKLSELLIFALRYKNEHPANTNPESSTGKHTKVDEVADYIVKHCSEDLSLANIADTFYTNKCYLSRIFKEVTGFSVNEYLNLHRIEKAQKLLISTDMPISEVADECGYKSLTYFEKVFRSFREVTPLKYRNEYLKQNRKRTKKIETDIDQ